MRTRRIAMTALFASCLLLTACDDDAGAPKIRIDAPTTEARFSTSASELTIGGTASFTSNRLATKEVCATNLRTERRYEASLADGHEDVRRHVFIPDLQLGDNEIIAAVLAAMIKEKQVLSLYDPINHANTEGKKQIRRILR